MKIVIACVALLISIKIFSVDGGIINTGRITEGFNNFEDGLVDTSAFGVDVTLYQDLDGDGIEELVVSTEMGLIYLLWMNENHYVKKFTTIEVGDASFGTSVSSISDLDGDGIYELLVGGKGYNGSRGAVWIVWINEDGDLKNHVLITAANVKESVIPANTYFGISVEMIDDLDGDGINEIAVGGIGYNMAVGCVWILWIDSNASLTKYVEITKNSSNFSAPLLSSGSFGASISLIDDLDGDGIGEIAVGQNAISPVVYILFVNSLGLVKKYSTISPVGISAAFGSSISMISDLDHDGIHELAIGASSDNEQGNTAGALWIVKINENGNADSHHKISTDLGAEITFPTKSHFGISVSPLSSINFTYPLASIVVGTSGTGALWILEFSENVTIATSDEIIQTTHIETTIEQTTNVPVTTILSNSMTTQDETVLVDVTSVTDISCTKYFPCIETKDYCICPNKCALLGNCTKPTSSNVVLVDESVSIFTQISVESLSLTKTQLSIDFSTTIHVTQDLFISGSGLNIYLTSEEKEKILHSGQKLDFMYVEGIIDGSFDKVNIFVDGNIDTSFEVQVENNHFYLQVKDNDLTVSIIVISTISFFVILLVIGTVLLLKNKKFKELLVNKEMEMSKELAYQQSHKSQSTFSAEFEMES